MIRRLFNAFLTLGLLGFPSFGLAEPATWTTGFDVDLGVIIDLAAADGVVYAATYNGVFRSDDGRSWKKAGLQGRWLFSIATDTAGGAVYAIESRSSFSGYLWVSVDGGEHWKASDPGILVNALAADPGDPNRVWVASYNDTALRTSVDGGKSWERVETRINDYGIANILFDRHDGTMYLQAYEKDLYAKPAGGAWARAGSPREWITSVIASEAAPGVLYAASAQGVCKSTDHALTWVCPPSTPALNGQIAEIPAEGSLPSRLLWTDGTRIMTSDDGGFAWAAVSGVSPAPAYIISLAVDTTNGRAFAATYNRALRSDDRGASWEAAATGLRAAWIEAVASGPDGVVLAAGSLENIFASADDGASWAPEELPVYPLGLSAIVIDPTTSAAYAGGEYTLLRKRPGETWTIRSTLPGYIWDVALDPATPEGVWLATSAGLRHSADGGATWSAAALAEQVYALVVDPRNPSRIYAGSDFDRESGYYYYPFGGAVFASEDSGQTWTKSPDIHGQVQALVFDPFEPARLYAGTWDHGVASTLDGGKTFRFPSSPAPGGLTALVADPARRDTLYASTDQGVFRSRDRGRSWLPFGDGLGHPNVQSLAISADGRFLHAATGGAGVYDLALEDEPAPGPCVPGPARLCLLGGRFQLELTAKHKRTGQPEAGAAHALGDRAGYFGIASFTGDPALPEVAVKMLPDGAFGIDGFPFLYSRMTGAPFVLTVTDTLDGRQSAYTGGSAAFCGGSDLVSVDAPTPAHLDKWSPAPAADSLSLLGGRFTVTFEARTRDGRSAPGVPYASADNYGFFTLPGITGDAALPELVVKMLDGRGSNGAFWVFYGSLTGLDYTLTVRDEQTAHTRTYNGEESFCGGADIGAFIE